MNKDLPVIVLGAGGHAKVVIDALLLVGRTIIGIVDIDKNKIGDTLLGVLIIGTDETVFAHSEKNVELVNGMGSIDSTKKREMLLMKFKGRGYQFATVIHPAAVVARAVQLGEGIQIMAGAIVQAGCNIGSHTIINTKASVDHDCRIGANVHIAPGVTLSGGVQVGDNVHIGTGATVIQEVQIGSDCLIAAGTLVLQNVMAGATMMGVPGKVVKR